MEIRRDQLVQMLHDQGHKDQAYRAERELPEHVDTDKLEGFDFDIKELMFKMSGEYDSK
jgi:hypothetical protein